MGSYAGNLNMLDYLRTKSKVDCDSLDVPRQFYRRYLQSSLTISAVAKELGPFVGSTSNQADAYLELLLPHREGLLQESLVLARHIHDEYHGVPFGELALEIAVRNSVEAFRMKLTDMLDDQARISYCAPHHRGNTYHGQSYFDLDLQDCGKCST